jgi:hypothetical protein
MITFDDFENYFAINVIIILFIVNWVLGIFKVAFIKWKFEEAHSIWWFLTLVLVVQNSCALAAKSTHFLEKIFRVKCMAKIRILEGKTVGTGVKISIKFSGRGAARLRSAV